MSSIKRKRKRDEQKVDEGMKAEIIEEEMKEKISKEEEEEEMKGLEEEDEVWVREDKLAKKRREQ